jgi:calcineurin-like phosphoesterase family protein
MSKIYLIGDSHLCLGYPNNVDKWTKVHQEYFKDFLIPLLKEKVKPGDIIIHLGDLYDNRNVIPINLLNYGMEIVEEISKIAPFHIIVGNHDLWSRSASEINTIRPFKYIPNVHIYDKPTQIEYNNLSLLLMPYIESKKEQIKVMDDHKKCHYLFCHSDLNGAKMHLTSVAHKNNDKIDAEYFSNFKKAYTGHIHIRQVLKNVVFVGSIFQMDRNDYNDQKGITVLDTNTGEEEFFPNTISPVFKKVKVIQESDLVKLEQLKDSKDWIDLTISNNLLISSRKIRRKIESILETGGFATVEYLDDINKESDEVTEDEKITEEKSLDISIQLDYEEYIKGYVKRQKYENEKIQNGILSEFSEVIKIYQENYKDK